MIQDYNMMTDRELEAYVAGVWDLLLAINAADSGGKHYDPLTVDGSTLHSYVFDLWDGGRHHPVGSLTREQVAGAFIQEAKQMVAENLVNG